MPENTPSNNYLTQLLFPVANSASIALAEEIGGTESKFVDKMKAQLKKWGITDAKIVNASGLNNSYLGIISIQVLNLTKKKHHECQGCCYHCTTCD